MSLGGAGVMITNIVMITNKDINSRLYDFMQTHSSVCVCMRVLNVYICMQASGDCVLTDGVM